MAFDTLDTTPYFSSLITISGGGLTALAASSSLTATNHGLVRPFEGKSAGKWYIEIHCTTAGVNDGFAGYDRVGVTSGPAICNAGGNGYGMIGTTGGAGASRQFGLGYSTTGYSSPNAAINTDRLYLIGQNDLYDWPYPYTSGDIIGLAMDLDNKSVWWRVNTGPWLGSTNTGNPATNTGGVTLTWIIGNGQFWPSVSFGHNGQYTFNFGASGFTYAVPSGFTAGWTNTNAYPLIGSLLSNGLGGFSGTPRCIVSPYVCRANGVITGLQGECTSTVQGIPLIYDSDGAGAGPGTLLMSGPVTTGSAGVVNYVFTSSLGVTSGHKYYPGIFIHPNGPYCDVSLSAGGGSDMWEDTTVTYPTPNATFVQSSNTTSHLPIISVPLGGSAPAGYTQGQVM